MMAVDVRDEVQARAVQRVRRQRLYRHGGPQIRPANADIDDVGDAHAGVAGPAPAAHRLGEGANVVERAADVGHHISPVDPHRPVRTVAQRHVQDGAVLGGVNRLTRKHPIALRLDAGPACELEQCRHRVGCDQVLRIIDEEMFADGQEESLRARRRPRRRIRR